MTEKIQDAVTTAAPSDAQERNFANLRKALEEERLQKQELAERVARLEASQKKPVSTEEYDDGDPYVDNKKLDRKLSSFASTMEERIEKKAQEQARKMIEQERQQSWLKQNPDFYDVMQHAQKIQDADPDLADAILGMPDNFDRQKLVYKSIKLGNLHKPVAPKETIQDKINNNKKSIYYQPTDVSTAPYSTSGDFSEQGQKAAYDKLIALKKGMRM